jgi:HK97 family phage prohead protease
VQKKKQDRGKEMSSKKEFRFVSRNTRAAGDAKNPKISGYAATFDSPTEIGGSFTEVIMPGAFKMCLSEKPDVRCLFNHKEDAVLGRTTAGTLRLKETALGLWFECDMPNTQAGRDVYTMIQRGDVSQCSFGFVPTEENWLPAQSNGLPVRQIVQADVFDVSPVTFPAYESTSVSARSLFPEGLPDGVERRAKRMLSAPATKHKSAADAELDRLHRRFWNLTR